MNSAVAVLIGLAVAIILIIKKISPIYSLFLGAVAGGLLGGAGLEGTVSQMISGVKDIVPAIARILAAGVLTGALITTRSADSIAHGIIKAFGRKQIYLALALSAMILTGIGVFIDITVITIAPIAILLGNRYNLSKMKLLLAMIGGGKCGNIISPNPNTIISAQNFDAPLSSVMAAGFIPALIGLVVTVFVIIPLMPEGPGMATGEAAEDETGRPGFMAAIAGPLAAIAMLTLRPICNVVVDPMIALPVGGLVCIIASGQYRRTSECLSVGLQKMSGIAVLLVGTGALAGVIKASCLKDIMIGAVDGIGVSGFILAPLSSILMCAASASTTAGATLASASFAPSIMEMGVSAILGAAMINAGATVLDHLPHGSFFHATGGSMSLSVEENLKLIPWESAVGLVLVLATVAEALILR